MNLGKDVESMIVSTSVFQTIKVQKTPFAIIMPDQSLSKANIEKDDVVFISPSEIIKNGDFALVIYKHRTMIRKICFKANGDIELQTANSSYKTILVKVRNADAPEACNFLGRVVSATKQKNTNRAF